MNEPMKTFTAAALASAIEDYCQSQRHSRDVSDRWLSSYLDKAVLGLVRQVRNNNLDMDLREQVNAFRLTEIEKEKQAKQKEIDALDREAKKLVCVA
jgi:hypothetical protein